ncbi:hypothetical protein L484_002708 [Morus notabilis]|uniref:Uncharacterized protein n=1 Tax=Morus notabilis TaxID=981085 RepID=W9RI14_9ROSA|nr:hypothetical protein L484_002708 [Morus notabilis]
MIKTFIGGRIHVLTKPVGIKVVGFQGRGTSGCGEGGSDNPTNCWELVGERICPREGVGEMDGLTEGSQLENVQCHRRGKKPQRRE